MKPYTKKTIDFYNKNIDTYIKEGAIVLNEKIDKFIKMLTGKKILDVACGPGHDTDYLTRKGFDCLGIDLSEKMIEYAKQKSMGKFEVMDFFKLDFEEKSFDGIWCSSALTHVHKEDINELLHVFLKILKKSGILGIIVPANQKRVKREKDTRIFTMFDISELNKFLTNNRFKVVNSELFTFNKIKWVFIIAKKIEN